MRGLEARLRFDGPLDLAATWRPLGVPFSDPTVCANDSHAVRASRTPEGPATLHVAIEDAGELALRAWGDGARWMIEHAAASLGLDDAPFAPPANAPRALQRLAQQAAGDRLARTGRVVELLVPIVLEQLVSGAEASRAYARLVRTFSDRAPGPFPDLWLPLGAEQIRAIPMAAFPACGALARQGATLHELARRATRVEEAAQLPHDEADRRLRAFPGVGPWTSRSAMLRGMGFPDAVPLGDYHLPSIVAWNLAGEAKADDARMLELLEPWRGQRGRIVRWITYAGAMPARRSPRAALREVDPEARALLRRS
ncbi:MAG: hypothetical protein DCC71_02655 [Proteobacteria bacterium]|nr:MAG: hypothetical protein DCC71_02655 [Pseudomonadota bacterium]